MNVRLIKQGVAAATATPPATTTTNTHYRRLMANIVNILVTNPKVIHK